MRINVNTEELSAIKFTNLCSAVMTLHNSVQDTNSKISQDKKESYKTTILRMGATFEKHYKDKTPDNIKQIIETYKGNN